MAENTFAFGDILTHIDEKTEEPEYPAFQSLYGQKCNLETTVSATSRISCIKDTDIIHCEENIPQFNNSAQIDTSKEVSVSESLTNISETANYLCHLCTKRYTSAANLKIHMASIHRIGDYRCSFCRKIFAFASIYQKHTERHLHVNLRPYNCSFCQLSFKTKDDVTSHKSKVHRDKKFECNMCNLVYPSNYSLRSHQSVDHKDEK